MLKKNKLGNTDLYLSGLGLGTVKFGRNTQVKYPKPFSIPSMQEIISLIDQAQQLGINTIDTAPAYGSSEQKLGSIFNDSNNNITRENFILITKAGELFNNNQSMYNFSADYIDTSINNSLKTLNTDYIDILLIHSDGNDLDIANNDALWQVLEQRKQQGHIRAYGVSSKTVAGGLACLAKSDLAMVTYRADYLDEEPVLEYAKNHNKGIILKKVLNSGNCQHTSVQDCLGFASSHHAVNSMIVGTINPNNLYECVQAIN